MRDGSRYEGEFKDGEINGTGERVYPDGSIYKGQFSQGEKHGYGEISYAKTGEWYKGEWHLNVRQGHGTLFTKDKNTFTVRDAIGFIAYQGDFKNHWPNGVATVLYNDGSHYHGEVVRGVKHGQGKLTTPQDGGVNVVYEGLFENGKR